jgi:hypothetical protein
MYLLYIYVLNIIVIMKVYVDVVFRIAEHNHTQNTSFYVLE